MIRICEVNAMELGDELRKLRQRCFLSQEAFAKSLNVSVSTINRWESGKSKPTLSVMKDIKEFCHDNKIDFSTIEDIWLNYPQERDK